MPLFDTALTRCTEIEARLRLHHVPDIGSQRFHKLIAAFGTAVDALQAPASGWRALGLPNSATNARSDPEIIRAATAAMAWL